MIRTTIYSLPSLSEHTFLRYFNFIALYFAQGISEGMLTFGIPAWMAANGKSAGEIASFVVIAVLPWSFKFIVAPLMDRYTYLEMGRKRPWVILGQIGLIISSVNMAFVPDPLNNLNLFMLSGFFVSFFGAFQDVATDGMAVDVIPAEQQAKANGLMWGSKMIGISSSLAVGSWILNTYDFKTSFLSLALTIGIIMFVPIFLRERHNEKLLPFTPGQANIDNKIIQIDNWKLIFKSLIKVFRLRNSLLLAVLLFITQGSSKYISTILPIFTVKELDWTNVEYSSYYASAKLIGGILGMILGGILIDKFGKKRMMNIYFICFVALISCFIISTAYWQNKTFIYAFMILQNIIYTLTSIAIFAIAMQCCWKKISASQFTLYMTIANLGQIAFASLIGPIREYFNWQISFLAFAFFIGLALLTLQFLNIEKQIESVANLDNEDFDKTIKPIFSN